MCSSLYPGKPLEVPGMIMRGAYGHIKHHRQAYHGAASLVDAAMSRVIPEFGRRPVLGRLREGVMSMPGATRHARTRRRGSTDRAYLAWAAVATAYAIAFLQRVSPQSVSLNFMHDFSTDAAGVAMLASSYFWGYTLMQIPAGLLVDRLRRQARGAVQHGGIFARQRGVCAGAEPARCFCRAPRHRLRRRAGFHRAPEACRAELQRRAVRRDVGHLAGVGLCRRRHRDDAAGGRGDRLWLARLLPVHRLRRPGQPRLRQGRAEAGSGVAQQQDAEKRRSWPPGNRCPSSPTGAAP